jgi:peptide/nickel transport system permease protein
LHGGLVLWLATTLVFVFLRILPGDPVTAIVFQGGGTLEQAQQRRAELGLDDPLPVQYWHYLKQLSRGDLGDSLLYYQPVTQLIGERLFPTLSLALASLGVALGLGMILGILGGIHCPLWLRWFSEGIVALALSMPIYLTALLAIYLFSVYWDILPVFGSDTLSHLILPSVTLGFHTSGSIARVLSISLREAFDKPYMLTARAKGLPPLDVLDHALRVALLPTLSVIALQIGFLLSGTVIIEFIFGRRGLGTLLYQAVQGHDYPLVQALTMLAAVFYMGANVLSQIARHWLDPRLKHLPKIVE